MKEAMEAAQRNFADGKTTQKKRRGRTLGDTNVEGPEGMTHSAIAETLGVSRERVCQIEKKAMEKLRHPKNAAIIKALL